MPISETYLALLEISLMLFVAEAFRGFASKYGLTEVVGELLAGILIGPYMLGGLINRLLGVELISINSYVILFSDFAVIMLIFSAGLSQGLTGLMRAGPWAILGATFGALAPFVGISYALVAGLGLKASILVGAAAAATSLAVASSVAGEVGLSGRPLDFIITAGAVDDVVSLIILSVAMGYSYGSSSLPSMLKIASYYIFAWVVIASTSAVILPLLINRLAERYAYSFSLLSLFGITALMVSLGFSPIIAAYITGLSLASSSRREQLKRLASGLSSLFGPLFFVIAGAEVNVLVAGPGSITLSLALTAMAIAFKVVGVAPFAYLSTRGGRETAAASLGMIPRGEMGLAIAVAGLEAGIIGEYVYAAIVLMVLFTTVIGALSFSWYVRSWRGAGEPSARKA